MRYALVRSFRLDEDMAKRLEQYMEQEDRSLGWVVRAALKQFLSGRV